MGKQVNKIQKQRRRKRYKTRLKAKIREEIAAKK